METEIKNFSIEDIQLYEADDDVDFAHVKLYALADGNNSHKNPIDIDVLKKYGNTILGKFIIGKFDKWKKDTTTHVPDQSILGYIPSDQEVTYEPKDGKIFITVIGLLSKLYAVDVVQMFKNGKNQRWVSCEFSCNEGAKNENGDSPILGFNIHAVTILGLDYKPSCAGAEIKVIKFAEDESSNSLKAFAEKRKKDLEDEKLVSHPIDKSKEAVDTGTWDADKARHDLVKEKSYATLAKSVCLDLGDGWEDRKITALGFPVMNIKDGKWVYNAQALSSALGASNGAHSVDKNTEIANKVIAIQKKLGLDKDKKEDKEGKMEEKFEDTEDVKDQKNTKDEEDIIMEKDKKKLDDKETMAKEKKEEPSSDKVDKKSYKEDGDPKDDSKDPKDVKDTKDDKKFSLDAYADCGAILEMLKDETEDNVTLAKQVMSTMSASDIVMNFVKMSKENKSLKDEKANKEKDDKDKKVFAMLASIKNSVDYPTLKKLEAEADKLSLSELDGEFSNKVKSFAKDENVTVEHLIFANYDNIYGDTKNETVDDIIKKYIN